MKSPNIICVACKGSGWGKPPEGRAYFFGDETITREVCGGFGVITSNGSRMYIARPAVEAKYEALRQATMVRRNSPLAIAEYNEDR